jgi:hypothetical protein
MSHSEMTPSDLAPSIVTFNVFDHIPQFGVFVGQDPANYTPPAGVTMWSHGTVWLTKLTAAQQAMIGGDLAARITYHAQCDNYDRLGGLFFILKPKGQMPQTTDPQTELVRFITPFSDYRREALASYVFSDADLSPYASVLADNTQDVWIGIAGGSNPYKGDPCTGTPVTADFSAIGFKYSVDFTSSKPLSSGTTTARTAVNNVPETGLPITGTFTNPGSNDITGHVTVIVSGHGAADGGCEYLYTQDTLTLNGQPVGTFSTMIDCAPYAMYSPDGNPGIFQDNTSFNPRNWCPGALVPAHSFPVTLKPGSNPVSLDIQPSNVPMGSNYPTSINFSSP